MCVYDSYSDIIYFVGNASGSWVGELDREVSWPHIYQESANSTTPPGY